MKEREVLAAADAVFDAERALRRAAETVDELSDVAASSLRVLHDAASDAFYAHQEERRDFHLESAGEHLGRLRNRSGVMNELGDDLTRHLTAASGAIERAGHELGRGTDVDDRDVEIRALRTQIDVLAEVVALARPVADQITRHAQHAAESATATDALMLLDSRVHHVSQEVTRADESVSMMRSVIESAQSRARTSAALAGVTELRGRPCACLHVGGPGHNQSVVQQRSPAADPPARQAGPLRHHHLNPGERSTCRGGSHTD